MAVLAFTDAKVVINSVDLSDHVKKVTLSIKADDLDTTAMGATYHARIGGLKDWDVSIDFNQDFAAAKVDATLFPLIGTTTTVSINPTSGANSATNPNYSGSVLVSEYPIFAQGVGDLAEVSVSWSGAGALARAIV